MDSETEHLILELQRATLELKQSLGNAYERIIELQSLNTVNAGVLGVLVRATAGNEPARQQYLLSCMSLLKDDLGEEGRAAASRQLESIFAFMESDP